MRVWVSLSASSDPGCRTAGFDARVDWPGSLDGDVIKLEDRVEWIYCFSRSRGNVLELIWVVVLPNRSLILAAGIHGCCCNEDCA